MKKTIITLVAAATLFAATVPVATTVLAEKNQTAVDNLANSYTVKDWETAQNAADKAKADVKTQEKLVARLEAEDLTFSAKINKNEALLLDIYELITKYEKIKDTPDGLVLYNNAKADAQRLNQENAQLRLDQDAKKTELGAEQLRLTALQNIADAAQKEADRIKGLIGKPKTSNGVTPTGNPTTASTPNTAGQPDAAKPADKPAAPAAAQTATGAKTLPKTSAVK